MPARHRLPAALDYAEPSRALPISALVSLTTVLLLGILSALLSLAALA